MWVLAMSATLATVGGHDVTIAAPKKWKVAADEDGRTFTRKGATLAIAVTAHDEAHPLDLEGALHDLLATVALDAMDEVAREEHDGYPTWFVMLHGEGRLGAAGVIDAGPVTIRYVLDAPAARFAADAEVLAAAIESVRVDGAEGPFAYPRILEHVYWTEGWWLRFHDDGTVEQAVNEYDLAHTPKRGTWTLRGTALHLEFADGTLADYDFSADDDGISLDGLKLQQQ
jgi:hypothetical protein